MGARAMGTRILIVEDDAATQYLCKVLLTEDGYQVELAQDLAAAHQALRGNDFDLVVLDRSLPDGDGLELLQAASLPPVLIMTLHQEPNERVEGFEAGALDYLTKPFHPQELRYRIKRILTGRGAAAKGFGPWRLSDSAMGLRNDSGAEVTLTGGESQLVRALLQARGRTVSREHLATVVAQGYENNPKTVDVLVFRLRQKIENDPHSPAHLLTVRGEGYRLADVAAE